MPFSIIALRIQVCAVCFSAQVARRSEKNPQQLCSVLSVHGVVKAMHPVLKARVFLGVNSPSVS